MRLEFELAYLKVTHRHFSYFAMVALSSISVNDKPFLFEILTYYNYIDLTVYNYINFWNFNSALPYTLV